MKFETYEDMTQIKDSMQLDSETCIAYLEGNYRDVEIKVQGEVRVYFDEDRTGNPTGYRRPSEFPQALKDIISGKAPIVNDDAEDDPKSNTAYRWELDDRVCVEDNNWFEMFVYDKNGDVISYEVIDVEGQTDSQLFELMVMADVPDDRMTVTEPTADGGKKVFIYHKYNDGDAYGEQVIRVFDTKDKAVAYMHNEACDHFGVTDFYEIPHELGLTDEYDYTLEHDYVSIEESNGYTFFVVEEKEVE